MTKKIYHETFENCPELFNFLLLIKWNKYRSQMTIQSNNNNLNYLIDPTFTKINKLFFLSFEKIEENNVKKIIENLFYSIMFQMLKQKT